jgi:type I restriction enzyme M protein
VQPSTTGDGDARDGLDEPYRRALDCRFAADGAAYLTARPFGGLAVRLDEVCDVKAGYSYSRLPARKRSRAQGVPIVLPQHLRDGRIVADDPPLAPQLIADGLGVP